MKKLIGASLLVAALGLPLVLPQTSAADEVKVEKKTTTTSPSGTVVVENETSRTFKLQGDTHVYTAPADVDLKSFSGKEVTVSVDPNGNVTKVEKKTTTTP
jgi:hypothetical protein